MERGEPSENGRLDRSHHPSRCRFAGAGRPRRPLRRNRPGRGSPPRSRPRASIRPRRGSSRAGSCPGTIRRPPSRPGRVRWPRRGTGRESPPAFAPSRSSQFPPIIRRVGTDEEEADRPAQLAGAGSGGPARLIQARTIGSSIERSRWNPSFSQTRCISRLSGRISAVTRARDSSRAIWRSRRRSSVPIPRPWWRSLTRRANSASCGPGDLAQAADPEDLVGRTAQGLLVVDDQGHFAVVVVEADPGQAVVGGPRWLSLMAWK